MADDRSAATRGNGAVTAETPRTVSSSDLFAGAREVVIEHDSESYRLRWTSKGKLILTK